MRLLQGRLIPAPRGAGLVAAPVPKKLLQMAGVDECFTQSSGQTRCLGNFVGWGSWDPWSAGDDRVQCFVHGKMRGATSCVMSSEGVWTCRPDSACKTSENADATETQICATHGSSRAVSYMAQGPDGKWHCKVGRECKSKGGY